MPYQVGQENNMEGKNLLFKMVNFCKILIYNEILIQRMKLCLIVLMIIGCWYYCLYIFLTSHPGLQNGLGQGSLTSEIIRQVEMFICKFYEAKSTVASVNDLHYKIFLQGNKEPEKLPPTHDALLHHIRRAHFQSYIWYHANEPQQELPSPVANGWSADATLGNILPTLMSQPALPQN